MSRDIWSYLTPCVSILCLALGAYSYWCLNFVPQPVNDIQKAITLVYLILVAMALWSLIAAFYTDPGFVPLNYQYNEQNLSPTAQALLNQLSHNSVETSFIKTDYASIAPSK